MIAKIYYCDICKKRIRKNQKVWFEGSGSEFHFNCKYKEMKAIDRAVNRRLARKLADFITNN